MSDRKKNSTPQSQRTLSRSHASSGVVRRYDPLDAFLKEIQRYPLLTSEEEKELAERYAKTGDVNVAARLVTSNLRLVVKIAFEYRRAYRNIMDLIQEGNIGLMQAVKRYDPSRGVKLSSYAAWWIRAYILRFIVNNWRLVKLGTTQTQRRLFFNLSKEQTRLMAMGAEPTPALLAERLGVTEQDVVDMERRLLSFDVSLDAEVKSGEERSTARIDLLTDEGELQDDRIQEARYGETVRERLESFAEPLTAREDFIFRNRLVSEDPLTLQEIGDRYGITRERVRQIEKRLMDKLRTYLESEMPEYLDVGDER